MRLEHRPEGAAATPPPVSFSEAEVSELLDAAMARYQQDQVLPETVLGIEDAIEIARAMDIPEEYVRSAAEELVRRRAEAPAALTEEERARRRDVIRSRRLRQFVFLLGGGLLAAGGLTAALGLLAEALPFLGVVVIIAASFYRWLTDIDEEEIKEVKPPR